MAIKVGGTTVIDDSRNLCSTGFANVTTINATTICATTLRGDGVNITGISAAPPSQCFTACSVITAGSPVSTFGGSTSRCICATVGDPTVIAYSAAPYGNASFYEGFCQNPCFRCGHNTHAAFNAGFVNMPTLNWNVNFPTSANTAINVGYTPGAIGFTSITNAYCAGCCNTTPAFCCAATLSSTCWVFTTLCINTTTCNFCQKDIGVIASCPCVGTACCTNYAAFCRQQTQAIPHAVGAALCGATFVTCSQNHPYYGCTFTCNISNGGIGDSYPFVCTNSSTGSRGLMFTRPGYPSTQHMHALSCTGNKAYLMFYTQTPNIDLGTCCQNCKPAFVCIGECYTTVNMMTFSKCTDGINFCACPSAWTCVALTSNTDRIGYLTRDRTYMFDYIMTCGDLSARECVYNCYALFVRKVDDSFCTNYTGALVAGTCYTALTKNNNCSGCCCKVNTYCALPRFFPLAENCDGWIIGYSNANTICQVYYNTACGVICNCCSLGRFFAIKPTGNGAAIITSCVCLSDIPISCTTPLLLNASVCNQTCVCGAGFENRMIFTNSYSLDVCSCISASIRSCENCDVGSTNMPAPTIQLFDVTRIGDNVMRAHFVMSYFTRPGFLAPAPICECGTSSCTLVFGENKVDFCVDNSTCTLCILNCARTFRCLGCHTGNEIRALFGTGNCLAQRYLELSTFAESSNNFIFQGATWGLNGATGAMGGCANDTGSLHSTGYWISCIFRQNCSFSCTPSATGLIGGTQCVGLPKTPYGFWKYHGIQHDFISYTGVKCIVTSDFLPQCAGTYCQTGQSPCACAYCTGCTIACHNTDYFCGNFMASRSAVAGISAYVCGPGTASRSRKYCLCGTCPAAFGSADAGSFEISNHALGLTACGYGNSYVCQYIGDNFGVCTQVGLRICNSTYMSTKILQVDQNNSASFIGFANASGAIGSCIPVATIGDGYVCNIAMAPGCYLLSCSVDRSCPSCFDSILSSCFSISNPCIADNGPFVRRGSSCCPVADTKFCVYPTTDRGCVGFFSR